MKTILIAIVVILSILLEQIPTHAQQSGNQRTNISVSPEKTPSDTTVKADSLTCGLLTYEGQVYPTVKIGTQCWMTTNLNVGKWTDGSQMQKEGNNGIIEKYCFGNDFVQCDYWGGLYQWHELMGYSETSGVQGICPAGWHVPSIQEWKSLIRYTGGESLAGGNLKSTLQWQNPNVGATNSSGFSAYPGGYFDSMAQHWIDLYRGGYYWTSEYISTGTAVAVYLTFRTGKVDTYEEYQPSALSVRCIKN
ncbi:MAG: hypothetical protein NTW16_00565 [Bacteroidetes bacterium]|nr:hypothetical protein [Bacteroidota bacterium]